MLQSLELLQNAGTKTLHCAAYGQKCFSTFRFVRTGRNIMVVET